MTSPVSVEALRDAIRNIPDFPKPGIQFKDITPVLADARLFAGCIDLLIDGYKPDQVDTVVGIDARGFIFAAAAALRLNAGFVPVRKKGKLPWKRVGCTYDLEYGTDTVEMHEDALRAGERALVVDDVIATGGTARAAGQLVRTVGATVAGYLFLIELSFLKGRDLLQGDEVRALIVY
jgi:adenine phosphoribosyltransferase